MTNVIIVGANGKMGKIIRKLASDRDDINITAGVDKNSEKCEINIYENISDVLEDFDVVLDFSRPTSLPSLLDFCILKNKPLILCTTGYTEEELHDIQEASEKIPLFRSANMSIGVNVVNNVLKNISKFLYKEFDIEIIEKHHNQKVDAPSGTAILLADTIKKAVEEDIKYTYGREGSSKRSKNEIGIHAVRGGNIVGEHTVIFAGNSEIIEVKHSALSRDVFGVGALLACKFMNGKEKGFYSMDDLIK
ncbi:MAG: 4-hydroxy-tetrahydrodipicolinate reductase [Bacillota bacterium]|nr:4-hydroxy-tetrahydrodipicolinate reductase [Bacillota bacterium]